MTKDEQQAAWEESKRIVRVASERGVIAIDVQDALESLIMNALVEAQQRGFYDYPDTDCTPNEHPAYRRGDDHGFLVGIDRAVGVIQGHIDRWKRHPSTAPDKDAEAYHRWLECERLIEAIRALLPKEAK